MNKKVWCALFAALAHGVAANAVHDFSLDYAQSSRWEDEATVQNAMFSKQDPTLLARAYAHRDERRKQESLSKELERRNRQEKRSLRKKHHHGKAGWDSIVNWKKKRAEQKNQKNHALTWRTQRQAKVKADYEAGRYADLYMQPQWPHAATKIKNKHLLNVGVTYHYATDGYDSRGVNRDIAHLAFTENPIRVKDVLLASKLVSDGKLNVNGVTHNYMELLADKEIRFLGKIEKWETNIDLARYVWKRNISLGLRVPIIYKKNRLKASLAQSFSEFGLGNNGLGFSIRYGADTSLFIQDILRAKGMTELGGSSAGLGDVQAYLQTKIRSPYFTSGLAGINVTIPTAQKASNAKLWAPELGNGGHLETAAFLAVNNRYQKYVNPHFLVQASASMPIHVDRRVPKRVVATVPNGANAAGFMAFGDRVVEPGVGNLNLNEFDTTIRGLGDHVANFKLRKGAQVDVRVGNMVEQFISRRAFLDVYYNLHCKFRDEAWGLDEANWNLEVWRTNTHEIAHKVGTAFSYQYDEASRLRLVTDYVFAGRHVAKGLDIGLSVDYSF